MIMLTILFSKSSVFKIFSVQKPAFSNSSGLKSVFEKPRFRNGLVLTIGLTVETELRFQIFRRCQNHQ